MQRGTTCVQHKTIFMKQKLAWSAPFLLIVLVSDARQLIVVPASAQIERPLAGRLPVLVEELQKNKTPECTRCAKRSTRLLHAVTQLLIRMVVKVGKRYVHKVALLLRLEPRIRHHALVEMGGVRPHVLADAEVSHGVGDNVALRDHDGVLRHGS